MRRAELRGERKRSRPHVDRDDLGAAGDDRALDHVQADAAGADHRDARTGGDVRRAGHRANARQHRAPERCERVERHIPRRMNDAVGR